MPSGVDDDEDAFSQIALTPSSIKRFRSREASANTSSSHKTTLTLTDEDPFPPGSSSSSGGGGGSERLEDMTLAVRALEKRRKASNATSEPDGASSSTDAFANMTDSDSVSDTKTQPDEGSGKSAADEIEALTGEDSTETTRMSHGVIPSLLERGEFDVDLAVISEDFADAQRSHDVEFAGRFASDDVVDALAPAHVDIPDSLRSEYLTTFGSARPPLKASGSGDGVLEQYRDVLLHAVQQHIETLQQRRPPRARKQRRRRPDAAATAWADDVADHVNDFLHTLEPSVKAFLRAPAADVEQRIVERLMAQQQQQQQQQVSVSDVGAVEARLGALTALVRDLDGTVSLRVRQELEALRDADLAAIHSEIDALRNMSSELDDVRTRVRLSELQLIEKRLDTNVDVPSSSPLTSSSSSARSWKCSTTVASVSLLVAIVLFAAELLLWIRSTPSGVSFLVPSSQALT